jgi:hypothetical protein
MFYIIGMNASSGTCGDYTHSGLRKERKCKDGGRKNVTRQTSIKISSEIKEGLKIFTDVKAGKKNVLELFERSKFFSEYNKFAIIQIKAQSKEDLEILSGYVESRAISLLKDFENNESVKMVELFNKPVVVNAKGGFEKVLIMGFTHTTLFPEEDLIGTVTKFIKKTLISAVSVIQKFTVQ